MGQALRIEQLDQSLRANGIIDVQHAMQLRRLIYATGAVNRASAEVLFRLDHACTNKDQAFASLYVEALTDYFVWQTEPRGYVTPEQARFLIDNLTADGHVSGATELELLLNVVHWARQVPEVLVLLVLESVRQSVLLTNEGPIGGNRPRRSIGAGDVAILRKALHAPAGDGSLLITRREADLLFDLNDATIEGGNDPSWTDFFAHAIANHLMNPLSEPIVPGLEDAASRDAWLNQKGSVGRLLTGVGEALLKGEVPMASVWEDIDPLGYLQARREAEAEAAATRHRLAREAIDPAEAAWLSDRVLRDGSIDETERTLLRFLKAESPAVDASLEALFRRAGF